VIPIVIIGAGLAGCEAVWQIAKRGGKVILYEMKPEVYSPAHRSPFFAEIVCSNSFKSESLENGPGVLKKEMELLESLVLKKAKETRVPAGGSLAVDREAFSKGMTHYRYRTSYLRDIQPGDPEHYGGSVSLFLRCHFPDRHCGIDRFRKDLQSLPVWKRRR
jgi:folate-dependent tRNA-U54 methylase TrmFO/GidA